MFIDEIEIYRSDKKRRDKMRKRRARQRRVVILKKIFVPLIVLILSMVVVVYLFVWVMQNIPSGEIVYVKKVQAKELHSTVLATITAYTSSVDETDDTPFITASGARTGHGIIACPPKYPFGTQVVLEGKTFTCEDRMNRRYHDQERFDIWVETKDVAFDWGVRDLEVKILK